MTAQLITYTAVVTVPISHIFQENLSTLPVYDVKLVPAASESLPRADLCLFVAFRLSHCWVFYSVVNMDGFQVYVKGHVGGR